MKVRDPLLKTSEKGKPLYINFHSRSFHPGLFSCLSVVLLIETYLNIVSENVLIVLFIHLKAQCFARLLGHNREQKKNKSHQ